MHKKLITTAVNTAILSSMLSVPMLASAQSGAQLEEVVVTARKRTESMQDVPIAVTVFTAQDIQDLLFEVDDLELAAFTTGEIEYRNLRFTHS